MSNKLLVLDEPFSPDEPLNLGTLVAINPVSWAVEFVKIGEKIMGVIFEEKNPKNSLEFFSKARGRELVFYLQKVLKTLRKPTSMLDSDDAIRLIDREIKLIQDYIKFSELPEEAVEQSFANLLKAKQGIMNEHLRKALLVWA